MKAIISALLGVLSLSGCTATFDQQKADQPLYLSSTDTDRTFEAAMAVLGRMHFSIDKADPKLGVIRTAPLPGGQFFEVWRTDNVGLFDHVQANLHTLRRTVWITVIPRTGDLYVDCLVKVQRLNVPSQAVSSTATAYRSLSESTVYAQGLKLSPEQQKSMQWVDLGDDKALAARILRQIERRLTHDLGHDNSGHLSADGNQHSRMNRSQWTTSG